MGVMRRAMPTQPPCENVNLLTALSEDLSDRLKQLDDMAETRLQQRLQQTVEAIVGRVGDHATEILQLSTQKNPLRKISMLLVDVIEAAADGLLVVPSYLPKAKAEQEVRLYDGLCWNLLRQQVFYDLVNACCVKAGLPMEQRWDPTFMKGLYESVAFRVARAMESRLPKGEAWVNLLNGTLEIKRNGTGVFRPHDKDDYLHYVLPYCYDTSATCPLWHTFLDRVLPDAAAQRVLAEYMGYCFTKGIKVEKMLVLYGGGSNGKSVVLDTMEALLGTANVSNVTLSDLTSDDEKRALIEGKLANISHESGKELDTAVLKQLVSGEPVDVRQLYIGTHIMYEYAKLVTSFNVLPRAEATHGFFRRFLLMPFSVTIGEDEADVDLAIKLRAELPGILNWVLDALRRFVAAREFSPCEVCVKALERYRLMTDSVRLFLDERCVQQSPFTTLGSTLYTAYKNYCFADQTKPLGKTRFYERLESLGATRTERRGQHYYDVTLREVENA